MKSLVRVNYKQASPTTTWTIVHNIGTLYPVVDCYVKANDDSEYSRFWPNHVNVVDVNTVELVFGEDQQGYATVM